MPPKPEIRKSTSRRTRAKGTGVAKKTSGKAKGEKKAEPMLIILTGKDLTKEKFDAALKQLAKRGKKKGADLRRFVGKVKIPGDPVEMQRELRRDHR